LLGAEFLRLLKLLTDAQVNYIVIELGGLRLRVLQLEKLMQVKRAAGRHKDFEAISELETLLTLSAKRGS
jgi:predicted nucleotidyltransferase